MEKTFQFNQITNFWVKGAGMSKGDNPRSICFNLSAVFFNYLPTSDDISISICKYKPFQKKDEASIGGI